MGRGGGGPWGGWQKGVVGVCMVGGQGWWVKGMGG